MAVLLISLPVLGLIVVANLLAARQDGGGRLPFNLFLFLFSALLLAGGMALRFLPLDTTALPNVGLQLVDRGLSAATLAGIGLWGMLVSLKPARRGLARLLPALDPESPVHTLALAAVGYLLGNAAISLAPGALEMLAEAEFEAMLPDVLAQQAVFMLAAALGVGWLTRRDSAATRDRLGLARPTARQLASGATWMLFFVFLQGCISSVWVLVDSSQAEQLSGINEALLGNFDTVWEWFLLAAAAGLGEELLFRGALQPIFGILPTALIFAVSHVQYGLTPATVAIFLLAVILGIIRKRSNTTVAVLVHAGYNFILGLITLLVM